MQLVEHDLSLRLERLCEQIVQILLIFLVDAGHGDRAAIAGRARASRHALDTVGAAARHLRTGVGTFIDHQS